MYIFHFNIKNHFQKNPSKKINLNQIVLPKNRIIVDDIPKIDEVEKRSKLKNLSNILTSLNLLCGFLSILFSFEGKILYAFYFIVLGLVFDLADGRIARALKISSKFGIEFDSMADLVTFGVAPSMLIYNDFLRHVEFGKITAFVQTIAVAIRLARFNLSSTEKPKEYFEGLSSPMGAFLLISPLILSDAYGVSFPYFEIFFSLFVLIIGFLEVSSLKFRSFKEVKFSPYFLFFPPFILWLLIFKQKIFLLLVFFASLGYIIYNIIFENYGKGIYIRYNLKRWRTSSGLLNDGRGKDKNGIGSGEARSRHN